MGRQHAPPDQGGGPEPPARHGQVHRGGDPDHAGPQHRQEAQDEHDHGPQQGGGQAHRPEQEAEAVASMRLVTTVA